VKGCLFVAQHKRFYRCILGFELYELFEKKTSTKNFTKLLCTTLRIVLKGCNSGPGGPNFSFI